MSSSPPHKRQRSSPSNVPAEKTEPEMVPAQPPPPIAPKTTLNTLPPPLPSTPNPRKRRASRSPAPQSSPLGSPPGPTETASAVPVSSLLSEGSVKKRGRTNTPWTAAEEQRLKQMRDAGNSWSEIAKAFPARTEGSVKKHWYKDMHYAEFAEDESVALREAIREYEANKWKVIGAKVGKPAKACEQYAKEHFKNL